MIATLKSLLNSAGCTLILYEREGIANVLNDQSSPQDVIGLIIEPSLVNLTTAGNSVLVQNQPIYVELLKQVRPEDTAENNRATFEGLLSIAKIFVQAMIRSGQFKKILSVPATKITENRYDANLIGWSLTLNIQMIENGFHCTVGGEPSEEESVYLIYDIGVYITDNHGNRIILN